MLNGYFVLGPCEILIGAKLLWFDIKLGYLILDIKVKINALLNHN